MRGRKGRSNGSDPRRPPRSRCRPRRSWRGSPGWCRAAPTRPSSTHAPGARRKGLPRHHRGGLSPGRAPAAVVDDLRPRLLRGRDDPRQHAALRPRAVRRRAARVPAPVGRDDRRRHAVQQDGAGAAAGLRPDERAALRHLDGQLRQRRRLLPLQLFGGPRLRPHRAGRHLRARAARRPPRRCSTESCSSSGKSAAKGRSSGERRHPVPRIARDDGLVDAATPALGNALRRAQGPCRRADVDVERERSSAVRDAARPASNISS